MSLEALKARELVKDYCRDNKMTQTDFAEMVGITKSTFSRFMGAGKETTGTGSAAYAAIVNFFGVRSDKQEGKANEDVVLDETDNEETEAEEAAPAEVAPVLKAAPVANNSSPMPAFFLVLVVAFAVYWYK